MKPQTALTRVVFLLPLISGILAADPLPQTQVSFTQGAASNWNTDWAGVAKRTYFVQWSLDLVTWNYAPVVEFGDGAKHYGINTDNAPKFFLRLKYADEGWVSSLQEARDADFDGDGIPNYYEVENLGSDPFNKESAGGDSDGDGLPDGWEMFHFGGLGIAVPGAVSQPGGLTNKEKSDLGLGPLADNLTLTEQRITYTYDGERLEGVNFYSQREFGYSTDSNGNIETTTSD